MNNEKQIFLDLSTAWNKVSKTYAKPSVLIANFQGYWYLVLEDNNTVFKFVGVIYQPCLYMVVKSKCFKQKTNKNNYYYKINDPLSLQLVSQKPFIDNSIDTFGFKTLAPIFWTDHDFNKSKKQKAISAMKKISSKTNKNSESDDEEEEEQEQEQEEETEEGSESLEDTENNESFEESEENQSHDDDEDEIESVKSNKIIIKTPTRVSINKTVLPSPTAIKIVGKSPKVIKK